MDEPDVERLWSDKANWEFGIYRCVEDPRVVVPKRPKWTGWTINFAHPFAIPMLILYILMGTAPVLIMIWCGVQSAPLMVAGLLAGTAAIILVSVYLTKQY